MDDKLILAGRAKIGALVGPDTDLVPPDRLFFAGGGGSVVAQPGHAAAEDGLRVCGGGGVVSV